jgi:hypothetical protein
MARWTIINGGSGKSDQIGKDGLFYDNLDLTFLPDDVCAVQSADGITADIEKGTPSTGVRTSTEEGVAISSLSWWSNVAPAWQAKHEAALVEAAEEAAAAAAAAEAAQTP